MTTYERATRDYDEAHEQRLVDEIFRAVVRSSKVDDANAVVIRTGEIIEALAKMMALTLALSPHARSPTKLRTATDTLAKRLRVLTEQALHDPDFQQTRKSFFDGNDVGGHA
jgi:hypothetical protein